MNHVKSNVKVKIDAVSATLDERIADAIWKSNPERVEVGVDENGNILIDKDKHPDLYDWAANG